MRRAICFIEPVYAKAGEATTWKFVYTAALDLPKGALFKFDLLSRGSPQEWQIPQTNLKLKKNLIWAESLNHKITARQIEDPKTLNAQFEFILPANLKTGETFTIFMGTPNKSEKDGNRAQLFTARKRTFMLYIDPKGKGDYKESETFHLDVKGGLLKNLSILTP
ncbi:MAG: DUF3604 domain-containing protein, partial [Parachlamydiales bacterium]